MSQDVGISEKGRGRVVGMWMQDGGLCLVVGVDGQYNKAQTFILDTRWMFVKANRTKQFMSHDNRRQVNCRYQLLPDNTAFSALRAATLTPPAPPPPPQP